MNLEIKALGQTLAIGILALVVLRYMVGLHISSSVFKAHSQNSSSILYSGLFAAIALALGILAEDLSRSVVGKPPPGLLKKIWPAGFILPTHRETRTSCLFKLGPTNTLIGIEELGKSTAELHLFSTYGGNHGNDVESAIKTNGIALLGFEVVSSAAASVYYQAKNVLYQQQAYYQELSTISLKVDFMRSLSFISAILLGMLFVVVAFSWVLLVGDWLVVKMNPAFGTSASLRDVKRSVGRLFPVLLSYSPKLSGSHIGLAAILSVGIWLGSNGYRSEEFNFNARVYGIWISIHAPGFRGSFSPDAAAKLEKNNVLGLNPPMGNTNTKISIRNP